MSKRRSERRQGQRANASMHTGRGLDPEGQSSPQGVSGTGAAPYALFQRCPGAGDEGADGRCSLGYAAILLLGSGRRRDTSPSCCPMNIPREASARATLGAFTAWDSQACCRFGQVGLEFPSSPAFRAGQWSHSLVLASPMTFGLLQVSGEAARC